METFTNWKVVTAGAALTGLSLLGAGAAAATFDDRAAADSTHTVVAMGDSYWDDSWD